MWGKEVSAMVRKEMKKEEKNITLLVPMNAGNGGGRCGC